MHREEIDLAYLHVCAVFGFLLRRDKLDDVIRDGQKPIDFFPPPSFSLRGHGFQSPLLPENGSWIKGKIWTGGHRKV